MGNKQTGEAPNTLSVTTTPEQAANRITNDPTMPVTTNGSTVVERAGSANADIQTFIINSSNSGDPSVPSYTPYVPSVNLNAPAATASTGAATPTATCANSDFNCKAGVGQNTITPQQNAAAGAWLGQASTDYQRAAGLALASGSLPVATAFEIAAALTGLGEQLFTPSAGKVIVDTALLDSTAQALAKKFNVPISVVNEVLEREVKPRFEGARTSIDQWLGVKK